MDNLSEELTRLDIPELQKLKDIIEREILIRMLGMLETITKEQIEIRKYFD